jgi:hypothetical protein
MRAASNAPSPRGQERSDWGLPSTKTPLSAAFLIRVEMTARRHQVQYTTM